MKIWLLAPITILLSFSSQAKSDCKKALESLSPEWKWDKVSVPFDWKNPAHSEKIEVYYYFKNQDLFRDKKPIVFFNGGPTMAGYGGISLFKKIKAFDNENIIFIDQRGTGCSSKFKTYNPHSDIGVYKKYSSDSIVQDAEVIRRKLFESGKWKVYGQSYGGLIGFRYLELFPESVESAHIHGFGVSLESHILEIREKRIAELTPEFLRYKNSNTTSLTVGQIIAQIKNASEDKKELFSSICVETPAALKKQLCGEDIFLGLYMITGFKNLWATAHKYLFNILLLIEAGERPELSAYYEKFVGIYLLRFNDPTQAAALHAITFNELMPGRLFYEGCQDGSENDLISECRFKKNFLPRLIKRPTFQTHPLNLDVIKSNIKNLNVPVYYYGGVYDSFIPVELLRQTADYLGISSSLHIFDKSGHEGFSTEKLVIDTLLTH